MIKKKRVSEEEKKFLLIAIAIGSANTIIWLYLLGYLFSGLVGFFDMIFNGPGTLFSAPESGQEGTVRWFDA